MMGAGRLLGRQQATFNLVCGLNNEIQILTEESELPPTSNITITLTPAMGSNLKPFTKHFAPAAEAECEPFKANSLSSVEVLKLF
jgi:hypothetical protein